MAMLVYRSVVSGSLMVNFLVLGPGGPVFLGCVEGSFMKGIATATGYPVTTGHPKPPICPYPKPENESRMTGCKIPPLTGCRCIYGCCPKNRGKNHQNGWFIMGNAYKNGWFGGTIIFGNTHIFNLYWKIWGIWFFPANHWFVSFVSFRECKFRDDWGGWDLEFEDEQTNLRIPHQP